MLHLASATMESGSPRMLFSSDRDEFTATKKKKAKRASTHSHQQRQIPTRAGKQQEGSGATH